MQNITMAATCLLGLEGLAANELKFMGASEVRAENGRVLFSGDASILARANLCLRTAERVQILLGSFRASSFEELFEGTKRLPFEEWIGSLDRFPVKGYSLHSTLHSVPDCQSIIKKAVVERLKQSYRTDWFEETGPTRQIRFSILKDQVSIFLDTSGEGLHKRGYRPQSMEAPLKETLAAAMVTLARVRGYTNLYDPFCGSGTILIEGALSALQIAPGLSRSFAAERWDCIPGEIWKQERARAADAIRRDCDFEAFGSDIDEHALEFTEKNMKRAGVEKRISLRKADISEFTRFSERGTVITNPPYGERLLDIRQAEELYRAMGRVFQKGRGWSYHIISPHENFEGLFGQSADKRRKIYNGMIKCQVYQYFGA